MAHFTPGVRSRLATSATRRDARSPWSVVIGSNGRAPDRESAQSPHCIALQVATVRYIELMKLSLTCDDARKTRSPNV